MQKAKGSASLLSHLCSGWISLAVKTKLAQETLLCAAIISCVSHFRVSPSVL